uniref:Uncharacterized protein TCIL3000_8_3560 n=1 Tax=Trypanosoma congolense (strain IL3000) TaxID=1068625 RepID=G0URX5_TRYCI|nr:unnamed protein product [Trypanosoma congolense IL3000]
MDLHEGARQGKSRPYTVTTNGRSTPTAGSCVGDPSLVAGDKSSCLSTTCAVEPVVPSSISPCPHTERLRNCASEDRVLRHVRKQEEHRQAKEREQRLAALASNVTIDDYYNALFRCPVGQYDALVQQSQSQASCLPPLRGVMTRAKEQMILESLPKCAYKEVIETIDNYFMAAFYKENPEALERMKQAGKRRLKPSTSTAGPSISGKMSRTTSVTAFKGSNKPEKTKKRKKRVAPKERCRPENLSLLESSLLSVADKGCITLESFHRVLRQSPFQVRSADAVDNFFHSVRTSSSLFGAAENSRSARLGGSQSSFLASGCPRSPSNNDVNQAQHSSAHRVSDNIVSLVVASSMSTSAPKGHTPAVSTRGAHGGIPQDLGSSLQRGGASVEAEASPTAYVHEIMGGFDALVNGTKLGGVVRKLCFGVLESDSYIHKSALASLRRDEREGCEDPASLVTPSMVKALGDTLDLLHLEEEQAYLRSQLRGRRKSRSMKAPTLLSHQKNAIPLHMMRRSHIRLEEFSRFFDTMPFLVAAFTHVWLPAFFAAVWPPAKSMGSFSVYNDDDNVEEDCPSQKIFENNEEEVPNEAHTVKEGVSWEVISPPELRDSLCSAPRRRHLATGVVQRRLAFMNGAAEALLSEMKPPSAS